MGDRFKFAFSRDTGVYIKRGMIAGTGGKKFYIESTTGTGYVYEGYACEAVEKVEEGRSALDRAWAMRERIESAFSKEDIDAAPIAVLASVLRDVYIQLFCEDAPREALKEKIVSIYDDLCKLTDENTPWWDQDDDIKKLNIS